MGLYLGGIIIGRIFASEIWPAYFRKGLFFNFYLFIYFFEGGGGRGRGGLLSEFHGTSDVDIMSKLHNHYTNDGLAGRRTNFRNIRWVSRNNNQMLTDVCIITYI